jgi:hypothetical protein
VVPLSCNLQASDGLFSSVATVTISVHDVNNNHPVFERESYIASVQEDTAVGKNPLYSNIFMLLLHELQRMTEYFVKLKLLLIWHSFYWQFPIFSRTKLKKLPSMLQIINLLNACFNVFCRH